jgi:hypothetical protein
VGDFGVRSAAQPAYYVRIVHYGWGWNLASLVDGKSIEAKLAALGYVFVPWLSTGANSARDIR